MSHLQPERQPSVMDPRPAQLLGKYASLAGIVLMDMGDGLVELELPAPEQRYWGSVATVRLALGAEALDEDPEAELLGIGSPAFECLVTSIRARGLLEDRGVVPAARDPSPAAAMIPVPLEGVEAGEGRVDLTLLPVGRLLARVSLKAGPHLEERLVESPLVDLSNGARLDQALVGELGDRSEGGLADGYPLVPRRSPNELLTLLFDELEAELATNLAKVRADAEHAEQAELSRLSHYYGRMLEEVEAEDDPEAAGRAKRAITAEFGRRKSEEEERYRVRVTVHPLQLTEWRVIIQQASWPLAVPDGPRGELVATRILAGDGAWRLHCPGCSREPEAIRLCLEGHPACPACSERCGVCASVVCHTHGLTECVSEGHPVCRDHARSCGSCRSAHCTTHSAHCQVGDHEVCPSCASQCARCGVAICRAHGIQTPEAAPRGSRWLCTACTAHCEGGTNEPVGLDEVVRCTSCERHICEGHRVPCAVDDRPHCSRHLRRSDHTGRLVCEAHRAACAEEPGSVLAADEVAACASCGRVICAEHGGECEADGARHCTTHLTALADRPGRTGCEKHRTTCHVDGVTFSVTGTRPCPVCGRPTCGAHRAGCAYCARQVCIRDTEGGRCLTCRRLEDVPDPADDLIQASLAANGGEPPSAKAWRTAQDASGTVVELDLGWTRRLVFTVPHGETKPRTVLHHSVLGAKRVR